MRRLVFSLPTRGSPNKLVQTLERNLTCLSRKNTLLMVQVDDDDEATITQVVKGWKHKDKRVMFDVREREDTVAAKWNRALVEKADVYVCLGDDDPLIDSDTDEKILKTAELFPDGIGMVYGYKANASFSSIISFTKRMVELLGYIQPEYFPYWFCDHWTDDIGKMIGRIAVAHVRTLQCIDHSHVEKTREMREPGWWATWFDANYLVRREHAQRILDRLDEPLWRIKMQREAYPLIEWYSRWVNDTVRANSRVLEGWADSISTDRPARYLRIKQKALDALPDILKNLPSQEAARYQEQLSPPTTIPNYLLRVG